MTVWGVNERPHGKGMDADLELDDAQTRWHAAGTVAKLGAKLNADVAADDWEGGKEEAAVEEEATADTEVKAEVCRRGAGGGFQPSAAEQRAAQLARQRAASSSSATAAAAAAGGAIPSPHHMHPI